ncbi:MAG: pilus assembly PilX N-terminal domain-containing protein [Nitrospirota bacterium]
MRSQKLKFTIRNSQSAIRNDKGFALVMVLLIAVVVLGVTSALLYMITVETRISGMEKKHMIALAATGEAGIVSQLISARGPAIDPALAAATGVNFQVNNTALAACSTNTSATSSDGTACSAIGSYTGLTAKINLPTDCWSGCDNTLTINPLTGVYDFRYDVGAYRTYGKIVDVARGNTGGDSDLMKTGVVVNAGQEGNKQISYLYTIELEAQAITNPLERTKLSILYQY